MTGNNLIHTVALATVLTALGPAKAAEPATIPGPVTEVRTHHGRPTFFVDGRPFTSPFFATYVPSVRYYRQMAEVGCDLFNFQTNCAACNIGFSRPTWKAPDQWDFTQIDERATMIITAKSDAMMLPRIYIGTPKWWRDLHPGEMVILDHGGTVMRTPCNEFMNVHKRPYASLAAPVWRRDMAMALRKTIEHMQTSAYGRNIFGYEIAALGSEEWYHLSVNQLQFGDYNPHMRRAFRTWVKDRYGTRDNLRKAWNRSDIDFDQVVIPGKRERLGDATKIFRKPSTEMSVIDFYIFWSEIVAETIDYFAGIVKEVTAGKKVVGAFYNYTYEFRGGPDFGHNAGRTIMRSDNLDFICAPPSYYQRQLASGAECYRRPFLPAMLHNKVLLHDNDLASFLFPQIMRRRGIPEATIAHYASQICPTPTAQESAWLYQRAAGFVLCEGIYESYFDLHGGYFDHHQLQESLIPITRALAAAKDHDRSSIAQILILADERSLAYRTHMSDWPVKAGSWRINESLMAHQIPFIKAGAPFDSGLLSDLEEINVDQYKLIVFLNTWHVSAADRDLIKRKLAKSGRVLVWCYAPGYFQGNVASPAFMEQLTGLRIVPAEDRRCVEPKQVLTEAGRNWLQSHQETEPKGPFGMEGEWVELYSVADATTAETLACLAGTQVPTMVRKPLENWTSVYSLTAVVTPEIVRAWAREAGVHVFSSSNDTLYANKSYVCINAATAGLKTIVLPRKADVVNPLTGHSYGRGVREVDLSLMQGESKILHYR